MSKMQTLEDLKLSLLIMGKNCLLMKTKTKGGAEVSLKFTFFSSQINICELSLSFRGSLSFLQRQTLQAEVDILSGPLGASFLHPETSELVHDQKTAAAVMTPHPREGRFLKEDI